MKKRWLAMLLAGTLAFTPVSYAFAEENGTGSDIAQAEQAEDRLSAADEDEGDDEQEEDRGFFHKFSKFIVDAKEDIMPILSEVGAALSDDTGSGSDAQTADDGDSEPGFTDKLAEFTSEFKQDVTPFISWLADELEYSMNSSFEFANWNEGAPSLEALKEYVQDVTDSSSPDFIPEEDRVAVFDMDGTVYGELAPIYIEWLVLVHRALFDPTYEADEEMKSVAMQVLEAAAARSIPAGLDIPEMEQEMRALSGMTLSEMNDYLDEFLETEVWGFEGMTYGEAFYQPMIEVVDYLNAYNFKTYLVSGSDRFLCRELIKDVLAIEPEHVIGSDCLLEATGQDGADPLNYVFTPEDEVVRCDELLIKNLKMNKVKLIAREIGRQPVLSFGNSSGDTSMAMYTTSNNPYRSEAFMLVADDAERDWADPAKAEALREKWEGYGWNVISMRDDFRTIYGDGVVRAEEMPEIEGLVKEEEEEEAVPDDAKSDAAAPDEGDGEAEAEDEAAPVEYVVQAHDNLWKIAVKVYGSGEQYRKIAEANNIPAPYDISAGQVLEIPAA